jgi:hypothetical protein
MSSDVIRCSVILHSVERVAMERRARGSGFKQQDQQHGRADQHLQQGEPSYGSVAPPLLLIAYTVSEP